MNSWFVQTRVESDRDAEPMVGAIAFEADDETAVVVFECHSSGGSASAAQSILEELLDSLPALPISTDEWEGALRMADRRMHADPQAGQWSAVGLTLTDELAVGASVGECHAWLLGDASWDVTRMQHLRPLLGTTEAQPIGFGPVAIDVALLAGTNSLFDQVDDDRALAIFEDGSTDATDALVQACRGADLGRLVSDVAMAVIRRKH